MGLKFLALALVLTIGAVNCQVYSFEEYQNLPMTAQQYGRNRPMDFNGQMAQQNRHPYGYGDFDAQLAQQYYQRRNPGGYGRGNGGDFARQMDEEALLYREKRGRASGRGQGHLMSHG